MTTNHDCLYLWAGPDACACPTIEDEVLVAHCGRFDCGYVSEHVPTSFGGVSSADPHWILPERAKPFALPLPPGIRNVSSAPRKVRVVMDKDLGFLGFEVPNPDYRQGKTVQVYHASVGKFVMIPVSPTSLYSSVETLPRALRQYVLLPEDEPKERRKGQRRTDRPCNHGHPGSARFYPEVDEKTGKRPPSYCSWCAFPKQIPKSWSPKEPASDLLVG
jgi:hypothetical protein